MWLVFTLLCWWVAPQTLHFDASQRSPVAFGWHQNSKHISGYTGLAAALGMHPRATVRMPAGLPDYDEPKVANIYVDSGKGGRIKNFELHSVPMRRVDAVKQVEDYARRAGINTDKLQIWAKDDKINKSVAGGAGLQFSDPSLPRQIVFQLWPTTDPQMCFILLNIYYGD
jgi:hypothetical protein